MITKLFEDQVHEALEALPGWERVREGLAIGKKFRFKDFDAAWAFMGDIAEAAEHANHHPDWSNVYNLVDITLTTHDAGGITQRDIDLATAIERIHDDHMHRAKTDDESSLG